MRKPQHTNAAQFRSAKDLASATSIAYSTIILWLNEGRIKGVRFGTAWRIPVEEYEHVLEHGVRPLEDEEETPELFTA